MLTTLLAAHADHIFWTGVALEVVGQIWLLFASYRCDVSLARWTLLFPPIALLLVVRHPQECLRPVILCIVAGVMIWAGDAYAPAPPPGQAPANPDALPN